MKNRAEIVIKIIIGKYNRIRVERNTPKKVWEFGMVWETEMYYRIASKDGRLYLEHLTGDTIDIYKWL